MYADPLVIYVDSKQDYRTFQYWLKQQIPQLQWDGIVVSISPDIRFSIEVSATSYDDDDDFHYSLEVGLYYVSERESDDENVIREQKQIIQLLLDCFKKQGLRTTMASPQYTDEDFD